MPITDPRITENTRVYQMTETVYEGVYEKEWDYDSNLHSSSDPKYPFAYYEGNHTIHFTDTPESTPFKNGDYFKGTIYFTNPGQGCFMKINWGWEVKSNEILLHLK